MIPFTYAVLDDDDEIVRKHRWSHKEAKWFMENNKDVKVIKLEVVKEPKENEFKTALQLVGECLF